MPARQAFLLMVSRRGQRPHRGWFSPRPQSHTLSHLWPGLWISLLSLPLQTRHIFLVSPTSDDDIVFEDFARQRLKGMKDDKEEEENGTGSPQLNNR